MNRRGAASGGLLFGLGSGLCLGLAADMTLLFLQAANPVPELIGQLGLPGALLALVSAFFLGAKAWQTLRQPPRDHLNIALAAEQRTTAAVQQITRHLEDVRSYLDGEIEKTRHALPSQLTAAMLQLETGAERRHDELLRALERLR